MRGIKRKNYKEKDLKKERENETRRNIERSIDRVPLLKSISVSFLLKHAKKKEEEIRLGEEITFSSKSCSCLFSSPRRSCSRSWSRSFFLGLSHTLSLSLSLSLSFFLI